MATSPEVQEEIEIAEAYYDAFRTPAGERVLDDLREGWLHRTHFNPGETRPDDLIFVEGFRACIEYILTRIHDHEHQTYAQQQAAVEHGRYL